MKRSDRPAIKLTIPQAEGATNWKVGLEMDQDVKALNVRTSDASMTVQDDQRTLYLEPLSNNDFGAPSKNVTIEYFFDDIQDIEANNDGEIPRWRHVCISKVIFCDYGVIF